MNVLLLLRVSGGASERASERWRESSEWMGGRGRDRTNNAIDGGGGGECGGAGGRLGRIRE